MILFTMNNIICGSVSMYPDSKIAIFDFCYFDSSRDGIEHSVSYVLWRSDTKMTPEKQALNTRTKQFKT